MFLCDKKKNGKSKSCLEMSNTLIENACTLKLKMCVFVETLLCITALNAIGSMWGGGCLSEEHTILGG